MTDNPELQLSSNDISLDDLSCILLFARIATNYGQFSEEEVKREIDAALADIHSIKSQKFLAKCRELAHMYAKLTRSHIRLKEKVFVSQGQAKERYENALTNCYNLLTKLDPEHYPPLVI